MSSTHAPTAPASISQGSKDLRAYLPIPFAVLAALGLGLFFSGGGQEGEPTTRGLIGAVVLCLSMPFLIVFASWLARIDQRLVRVGAGILALGGLTHLVENLVILGFGRGGRDESPGAWHVAEFLSPAAFAVLGLGLLLIGLGLSAPGWLRGLGVVAGVAGLVAGLSSLVTALGFLPGPFNVLALAFLIVVGVRRRR